jgi:hypothetical protein
VIELDKRKVTVMDSIKDTDPECYLKVRGMLDR